MCKECVEDEEEEEEEEQTNKQKKKPLKTPDTTGKRAGRGGRAGVVNNRTVFRYHEECGDGSDRDNDNEWSLVAAAVVVSSKGRF